MAKRIYKYQNKPEGVLKPKCKAGIVEEILRNRKERVREVQKTNSKSSLEHIYQRFKIDENIKIIQSANT